jgi:DNA-binding transcriptional ArsR family regulator
VTNEAAAFDALGDPTRRAVLELLRGGERTVGELVDALPVSQPAVSQHLKVLRDAGLVAARAEGTRRLYRVERDGLAAVRAYVDRFWDDVLDAFVAFADTPSPEGTTTEEPIHVDRPRAARRPRAPEPR